MILIDINSEHSFITSSCIKILYDFFENKNMPCYCIKDLLDPVIVDLVDNNKYIARDNFVLCSILKTICIFEAQRNNEIKSNSVLFMNDFFNYSFEFKEQNSINYLCNLCKCTSVKYLSFIIRDQLALKQIIPNSYLNIHFYIIDARKEIYSQIVKALKESEVY